LFDILENSEKKYIEDRLRTIYQDLTEALETKTMDEGWNNIMEAEINEISDKMKQEFPQNSLIHNFNVMSINGVGITTLIGQIKHLQSQVRKMANMMEFSLDSDSIMHDKVKQNETVPDKKNLANPRDVFVVHGRNEKARDGLFTFLRSIKLNPLEWSSLIEETGHGSPYIGDILETAFSKAHAIIVLMTPDDDAKLKDDLLRESDPPHEKVLTPQARPNVLFEAGMAMGKFPNRTILIELGNLRPFSDVGGRHVLRMNDSTQRRQELAQRLKTAGCAVDTSGTDWHTSGKLEL